MEVRIKEARRSVHKIAGLLTGASAGLECCVMSDLDPRTSTYISRVCELLGEAQNELASLQSVLRDLSEGSQEM